MRPGARATILGLTTIAQVHGLSKQNALRNLPVQLRPVVTYFDPVAHNLFLNDATGGIWMGWKPDLPKLKVGDLLDFKAETDFTFAPDVKNASWAVIGQAPMPEPRRVSYEEMISTSEDSQWVEVEGTVRQAEYLHRTPKERVLWMDLAMSGNDIDVEIPWDGSPVPLGLIDARISIRGICGAEFNPKNQMVGVNLYVPSLREIFTLEAAEPERLTGPPTPIGTLQRFGYKNSKGHRLKLEGVVTAVLPAQGFYLQDNSGSIYVLTRQGLRLKPGDRVGALGFVGLSEAHVRLEDAYSRRLGTGAPPKSLRVTPEQALTGLYDSELVTLEGRVVGRSALSHQQRLTIASGQSTFPVVYANQTSAKQLPLEGALVRLSGICVVQVDDLGQVATFRLVLNDSSGIEILENAPWWTVQRVMALLGFLGAAIALALAWVMVLRRRVRQQTHVISQKLAQEESLRNAAQLASRAKSEFLANMSHEIRTPMNAIVGFTDLLVDTPLNDEQLDYVRTVQFSSHSLTRILNDVLDFSKIEAGHLSFESVPFSISNCASRVLQLITPEADRKGLTAALKIDENVCDDVVGDPYRLHQVLLNLLSNSLKFTERGSITLAVACDAKDEVWTELRFSIIDTGIGIPEDAQQKIFESFSQADNSTTRKYGGTGLGLAICTRLIALFGGRIWLESKPGEGSRFHFTARFATGTAREENMATESAAEV
ncbi:MAG: ATP-binding protein [Acidobacteriota bacterium]|nr:ATP-binding protein [Acidobacteriota bacterium]